MFPFLTTLLYLKGQLFINLFRLTNQLNLCTRV